MQSYTILPSIITNSYGSILKQFDSDWLELINVEIQTVKDGRIISGKTKTGWVNPQIGLNLTTVQIILFESENTITISNITGIQVLLSNTLTWKAEETGIGTLIFSSDFFENNSITLEQAKKAIFFSSLSSFEPFARFESFSYQMHLSALPDLKLIYNWFSSAHAALPIPIGNDLFSINQFDFRGAVSNDNESEEQFSLTSHFVFAGNLTVLTVEANHPLHYLINLSPKDNGFDLSAILTALKIESVKESIADINSEIKILNNFEINRILLHVNKTDFSKTPTIALFGNVTTNGTRFRFTLSYIRERFSIEISLNNEIPPKLFDLFPVLNEKVHLPFNPSIQTLRLRGELNPISFDFFTDITNVWSIQIGSRTIELNEILLSVRNSANSNYSFQMRTVFIVAGIDITLHARNDNTGNDQGWLFETEVAHQSEIHLTNFITALSEIFEFTKPEHVPDLSIHQIDLSFHTGTHDFNFRVGVSIVTKVGPFKKGILNVDLTLTKNTAGTHDFSMDLNGFVEINEIHVDFLAENIGQKDWNASITYNEERHDGILTLEDICKFFDDQFEIKDAELASLALAHFEIDYGHSANGDHTFYAEITLNTKNGKQITGFFSGQHADNKWNIAVGIGYEAGNHETTPEIITEASTHFTLESIWIIFINSSGTWPKLPDSFPAAIKDQEVTTGLGVVAKIDLDQHDFVGIDELTNRGHSVLDIFVEITNKGLRVEADLEGGFVIETGKNSDLIIQKASLVFEIGTTIALIIKGKFDLHIDGFEQTLEVGLLIKTDGFALFADLKFSGEGWTPFGIDGMHIDELAFELGVDFAPPAVLVGFMGFSHLGEIVPPNKLEDVQDEFAMVLGFSSEIPNPEYFALKITKLGLSDLLALFPGTSSDGHSVISDSTFSVKDFELIWCEKPLILPNGKSGEIGFSCHGLVEIFGWKAFASLEIHPDSGIQGVAMLEKLEIGPLKLTGKSPGLKLPKGVSNIKVTAISADKSLAFDPNTAEMETIIAANGAFVQFNSSSSPYLNISFKLELLGITVAELNAEITDTKIEFDVALNLIIISINVTCILENTSEPYFNMTGEFFLGIDFQVKIDLLFVHIDAHIICGIGATIHLKEEKGTFTIGFSGRANFFGHEINMDEVSFSASIGDLKKLPEELKKIMNGEHTNNFSNDIKNASGHNNSSSSSSARFDMAHTLLLMATEWAQFVHADIQSLRHDLEKKSTEITELIKKIKDDITIINGSELAESHQDLNVEHTNHIAALSKIHKAAQPANADSIRLEDMKQMNNEIHWLADTDNKLRNSINSVWKNFENELNTAETSFIIGLEDHVTGKISEEQLQTIRAKREQVITTIKDVILKLEDEQGKIYPSNAVQHHSLLIELENRMLLDSNEILTIARFQAENIIKNSIRPTDQEPFILTPTTHE